MRDTHNLLIKIKEDAQLVGSILIKTYFTTRICLAELKIKFKKYKKNLCLQLSVQF